MGLDTQIVLLVMFLILSAFFSGSEVALVSLAKTKVRQMTDNKKIGSGFVKKLKDNPQRMLSTILIGNNVVNVAASALLTSIMIDIFANFAIGIATGIMTLLILIFGEITPKSIATRYNERSAQFSAPLIWYLSIVFTPALNILDKFLNKFINFFGIQSEERAVTKEEIITMLKIAEEEGSLKGSENLIKNIFKFDNLSINRIATHRRDMVTIDSQATVDDSFKLILKTGFSRIPVYEQQKDNIVGIIYLKDTLQYAAGKSKDTRIASIMKKPYFVPETNRISNLLRQLQKRKEHMAIVVDEHGSVTGLVTMEDILEEIVGDIMDETEILNPNIRKLDNKTWLVKGKTGIDEINDKLKMGIPEGSYDTLNGFILSIAGKIPKKGNELTYNGFKFMVEEVEGRRISTVKIEKTK